MGIHIKSLQVVRQLSGNLSHLKIALKFKRKSGIELSKDLNILGKIKDCFNSKHLFSFDI